LSATPGQDKPIHDDAQEKRLVRLMAKIMTENDAPPEAFGRLELALPAVRRP
jgi:hypothetical protein